MQAMTKQQLMDMLNGPLWNKLPRYALPVAATGILGQLFNAADIAVVGNFTGDARTLAVAAVGANSPIIGLIVNLFIGIALGANVVIATAIANNPRVIIADEPTGNLDPARSLEIMRLLERINQLGTTMVVVTHEKDLVNQFKKRVVTLEQGVITSDGDGVGYNAR